MSPPRDPVARTVRAAAGPALLAVALAAAAWLAGLHGGDLAAQVYRTDLAGRHGLVIWDPGWFGGHYPLGYSVLSPLLGAAVGIGVLAVASAGVAALAFDQLVGRRTAGSWWFAASTLLAVAIGQVAYLAGEAVALVALLALLRRRWAVAVVLAVVTALLSPLAAAFLVMACGVWAVHDSRRRLGAVAVALGAAVVVGALGLAFPGDGPFPFSLGGLVAALALSAVVLLLASGPVRTGAAVYGLACLAAWALPNPIGGNATRLAETVGVPLAVVFVTRFRGKVAPVVWAVVAILVLWQWGPGLAAIRAISPASAPATRATFSKNLVSQIQGRADGRPVRVEVVPTAQHWESAYVAAHVGLARGWERQLDVARNPIFYRPGALTANSYRQWLLANGIEWVALSDAPVDYAGRAEAALLQTVKVPGLRLVWSDKSWRLWQVTGSPGLLSGPGQLTVLGPDRVTVQINRPGRLLLRVRWTRYWRRAAGVGCVAPAAGGWTSIRAASAGTLQLRASLIGGGPPATC